MAIVVPENYLFVLLLRHPRGDDADRSRELRSDDNTSIVVIVHHCSFESKIDVVDTDGSWLCDWLTKVETEVLFAFLLPTDDHITYSFSATTME